MVWELCFHCVVDCMYTCLESRWFPLHQWLCYKVSLRSTAVSEKHLPKDDANPFLVERNWHNCLLLAIIMCNAWLSMPGVQWTAFTVLTSCYYSPFRRFCASESAVSMLFASFQNPPWFEQVFVYTHTSEALVPPSLFCPFLYSMFKLCSLNVFFSLIAVIFISWELDHQSVCLQNHPRHTLLSFFNLFIVKQPRCGRY